MAKGFLHLEWNRKQAAGSAVRRPDLEPELRAVGLAGALGFFDGFLGLQAGAA